MKARTLHKYKVLSSCPKLLILLSVQMGIILNVVIKFCVAVKNLFCDYREIGHSNLMSFFFAVYW